MATSSNCSFAIQKVDSILNIGPIVDSAFGESPSVVDDESNMRVALAKATRTTIVVSIGFIHLPLSLGLSQ